MGKWTRCDVNGQQQHITTNTNLTDQKIWRIRSNPILNGGQGELPKCHTSLSCTLTRPSKPNDPELKQAQSCVGPSPATAVTTPILAQKSMTTVASTIPVAPADAVMSATPSATVRARAPLCHWIPCNNGYKGGVSGLRQVQDV
jgi:hypothetical protein